MIVSLSLTLTGLIGAFLVLSAVVGTEERRGSRLALVSLRGVLDRVVVWVVARLAATVHYLDRHIIRLSWYYSLHSFLQALLKIVVSLYDYLEGWFHLNRRRARALRAERRAAQSTGGVLHSIAKHKAETALSPAEKKKLRSKKLERG
jgi:hypothetical protein